MEDKELEGIVQRMIDAGESEDNIALVIGEYKPVKKKDLSEPVSQNGLETFGLPSYNSPTNPETTSPAQTQQGFVDEEESARLAAEMNPSLGEIEAQNAVNNFGQSALSGQQTQGVGSSITSTPQPLGLGGESEWVGAGDRAMNERVSSAMQVYADSQGKTIEQVAQEQIPLEDNPDGGAGTAFMKGLFGASGSFYDIPRLAYGFAGFDGLLPYDEFLQQSDVMAIGNPLVALDRIAKNERATSAEYGRQMKVYEDGIFDSAMKGNWRDAGAQLLNSISESAPSMASMALTGSASSALKLGVVGKNLMMAAPFAAQKYQEIEDNPNMPDSAKPLAAIFYGLAETIPEQAFGSKAALDALVDVVRKQGKKAGQEAAEKLVGGYVQRAIRRLDPAVVTAMGGVSEAVTSFSQNLIARISGEDPERSLTEGMADAIISGVAMSAGPVAVGQTIQATRKQADISSSRKSIATLESTNEGIMRDLENIELTPEQRDGLFEAYEDNNAQITENLTNIESQVRSLSKSDRAAYDNLSERNERLEALKETDGLSSETLTGIEAQQEDIEAQQNDLVKESQREAEKAKPTVSERLQEEVPPEIADKVYRLVEVNSEIRDGRSNEEFKGSPREQELVLERRRLEDEINELNDNPPIAKAATPAIEAEVTAPVEVVQEAPVSSDDKRADIERGRQEELFDILSEEDKQIASKIPEGDKRNKWVKTRVSKTTKGNDAIERHNAEDALNTSTDVATRIAAKRKLESNQPFNGGSVSDINKVIFKIKNDDVLIGSEKLIKDYYDAEIADIETPVSSKMETTETNAEAEAMKAVANELQSKTEGELAEMYQAEAWEPSTLSVNERAIVEVLGDGFKVDRDSFTKGAGDKNYLGASIGRSYFPKRGEKAPTADQLAEEVNTEYFNGENVITEEDIAQFMYKFPNGSYTAVTPAGNPVLKAINEEYKARTGKSLNRRTAASIAKKYRASEQQVNEVKSNDALIQEVSEVMDAEGNLDFGKVEQMLENNPEALTVFPGNLNEADINNLRQIIEYEKSQREQQAEAERESTIEGDGRVLLPKREDGPNARPEQRVQQEGESVSQQEGAVDASGQPISEPSQSVQVLDSENPARAAEVLEGSLERLTEGMTEAEINADPELARLRNRIETLREEAPSSEQKLEDVMKGDISTFTYSKMSDVPPVFRDRISSDGTTNGKRTIRVSLPKSEAEFLLKQEENAVRQPKTEIVAEKPPVKKAKAKTKVKEAPKFTGKEKLSAAEFVSNLANADYRQARADVLRERIAKAKADREATKGSLRISEFNKNDAELFRDVVDLLMIEIVDGTISTAKQAAELLGITNNKDFKEAFNTAKATVESNDPLAKTTARNVDTLAKRAAYGFGEGIPLAKSIQADVIKQAQAELDAGYDVDGLIGRIMARGGINDLETAIIAQYAAANEATFINQTQDLETKYKGAGSELWNKEMAKRDAAQANMISAYDALQMAGRVAGQALSIRKALISRDFSLAGMMDARRKATGNDTLSPAQMDEVSKQYIELKKAYDQRGLELEKAQSEADRLAIENKILKERKVANRIKSRENRTLSRAERKAVILKERDSLFEQLGIAAKESRQKLSANPIDAKMATVIAKLAANYVQDGILSATEIVDNIYDKAKDLVDGVTKRDIADAISGYGMNSDTRKTRTELQEAMYNIRKELSLLSQIEDAEKKVKKAKNKTDKDISTTRIKELQDKLKSLREENNRKTDAELIEAEKERVRARIAEVSRQIVEKDFKASQIGGKRPADPELVALREEEYRLIKERDLLDTRKQNELSQKERDAYVKRLNEGIEELDKQIANKKKSPKNRELKYETDQEISELRKLRDEKRDLLNTLDVQADLESREKMAKKRLKAIQDAIKEGRYKTEPKKEKVMSPELKAINKKINDINWEFAKENARLELEKRGRWEKTYDTVMDLTAIPRQLMSSVDLSAILRQGAFALSRPDMASKAFVKGLSFWWSKDAYESWSQEIMNSPGYGLMQRSGLDLTIDRLSPDVAAREEMFQSRLLEKFPVLGETRTIGGVKVPGINIFGKSDRNYSGTLNHLRVNIFEHGVDLLQKNGYSELNNPEAYKALASYVNIVTGRGDPRFLGRDFANAMPIASKALFAPRFLLSRLQFLTATPLYMKGSNKVIRQMYARDLAGYLTFGGLALSMASLWGADVEEDPRSTDFGKIRFGDTRIDVWGGGQQIAVAAARTAPDWMGGGKSKTTTGRMTLLDGSDFTGVTRGDVLLRFARSKASPLTGLGISALTGSNYMGERFDLQKELTSILLPMAPSDIYENVTKMDNKAYALLLGAGTILGGSIQTYRPNEFLQKGVDNNVIDLLNKNKAMVIDPYEKQKKIYDVETGEKRFMKDAEYRKYSNVYLDYIKDELNNREQELSTLSESQFHAKLNSIKRKATEKATQEVSGVTSSMMRIEVNDKIFYLNKDQIKQRVDIQKGWIKENTESRERIERTYLSSGYDADAAKDEANQRMLAAAEKYSKGVLLKDWRDGKIELSEEKPNN